jgi:hypothetical protein
VDRVARQDVAAIHPKAMPVILTTPDEVEQWLTLPAKDAPALQRPLPDGTLKIVAQGEKEDPMAAQDAFGLRPAKGERCGWENSGGDLLELPSSLSDLRDQRNNRIRIAPATYKDCTV